MKKIKIILAITFSMIISSCASTTVLKNTPSKDSDFKHSLTYLKTHYSDINEYNGSKEFEFFKQPKFPKIEQLKKLWGKPQKVESDWTSQAYGFAINAGFLAADIFTVGLFTVATALSFPVDEIYEWDKDNIRITVHSSQDSFSGYEPIVFRWKWTELNNTLDKSAMRAR